MQSQFVEGSDPTLILIPALLGIPPPKKNSSMPPFLLTVFQAVYQASKKPLDKCLHSLETTWHTLKIFTASFKQIQFLTYPIISWSISHSPIIWDSPFSDPFINGIFDHPLSPFSGKLTTDNIGDQTVAVLRQIRSICDII